MEIESIRHKRLSRFIVNNDAKGVIEPERIRKMVGLILVARSLDDLSVPPNFGFHALTGDRAGTYAMTVTRNWRLTFTMADEHAIADLDLEDYH